MLLVGKHWCSLQIRNLRAIDVIVTCNLVIITLHNIIQVRLFLPDCHVCKSGATLVDLPGTRDSNAARDNVAKQVGE